VSANTDYYALLGVNSDATTDQIKRAYRKLARTLHPDVNPDPQAQEEFKQIAAAYDVLSDPQQRRMYDLGFSGRGNSPFGDVFGADLGGLGDFVDAFFGGGANRRGPRSRTSRGQDALIKVEVELGEAAFGVKREVTVDTATACAACEATGCSAGTTPDTCQMCRGAGEVQTVQRSLLGQVVTSRPCPQCGGYGSVIAHPCIECSGNGRVRTRRTLEVQIPAGVDTGTRVQLVEQGEVGPGGGPAADLYVEIVVRPHEYLKRKGDDLFVTLPLPMTAAALGTEVRLAVLDGDVEIAIPPGTQPNSTLLVRGRGIPRLRGSGRGDLQVQVAVVIPTDLDEMQKDHVRNLARLRGEESPELSPEVLREPGLFARIREAFTK
jgi:molecular chaperone DnaJ